MQDARSHCRDLRVQVSEVVVSVFRHLPSCVFGFVKIIKKSVHFFIWCIMPAKHLFPNKLQWRRNKISTRTGLKLRKLSFPNIALGINSIVSEYAGALSIELKQQILHRQVLTELRWEKGKIQFDTWRFYEEFFAATTLQTLQFFKVYEQNCCFAPFTGRCWECLHDEIKKLTRAGVL